MHAPYSFSPRDRRPAGCFQVLGYAVLLAGVGAVTAILALVVLFAVALGERP